jgi:catechol 2,3-dioxygenase-like lactoylglutathione lyase family enzyme
VAYRINHIHLKAPDPERTANWYVRAFNFRIASDTVRPAPFGDRFIRCLSEDGGMAVNISGALTGQQLGPGDAQPHHGLEHFGLDSTDLDADIARLQGLGAELLDGPMEAGRGVRIAFLKVPDDVRIEFIEQPRTP